VFLDKQAAKYLQKETVTSSKTTSFTIMMRGKMKELNRGGETSSAATSTAALKVRKMLKEELAKTLDKVSNPETSLSVRLRYVFSFIIKLFKEKHSYSFKHLTEDKLLVILFSGLFENAENFERH
jgi:hypothetical protein